VYWPCEVNDFADWEQPLSTLIARSERSRERLLLSCHFKLSNDRLGRKADPVSPFAAAHIRRRAPPSNYVPYVACIILPRSLCTEPLMPANGVFQTRHVFQVHTTMKLTARVL
jgi:hypothetical protein